MIAQRWTAKGFLADWEADPWMSRPVVGIWLYEWPFHLREKMPPVPAWRERLYVGAFARLGEWRSDERAVRAMQWASSVEFQSADSLIAAGHDAQRLIAEFEPRLNIREQSFDARARIAERCKRRILTG